MSEHLSRLHASEPTVPLLILSTASLFQVGRWKSRSALLEEEVPKRSGGSAPPELEVMNRSRPKPQKVKTLIEQISRCRVVLQAKRMISYGPISSRDDFTGSHRKLAFK